LRFLLTTTFYPAKGVGGDAIHVKSLAKELAKRGHEVHVLYSVDAHKSTKKELFLTSEDGAVHLHPFITRLNDSAPVAYAWGNVCSINRAFEMLVKQLKPDIVHHHNISLLGYGVLRKRDNYLNLYSAHDFWLICQQNNLLKNGLNTCIEKSCFFCALRCRRPLQIWRYRKAFKSAITNIDALIAPSNYLRNRVSAQLNVRTFLIPNFMPNFSSVESSNYSNFFLYVGILEKKKGILELISTYRKICHQINSRLLIVGDGSLKPQIQSFIKRNNLESKIFLLSWMNRGPLHSLMRDANAIIIPSICAENCPLVAIEAFSLGTPVISSNKGGLPEIVSALDNQLIYRSEEELINILIGMEKNRYTSRAKEIYQKYYTPEAFLKRYFDLIEQSYSYLR
jgi:glycosyltransferase involved in cell wall biosynthesis